MEKIGLLNAYGVSIYKHNFKIPQIINTFKEYTNQMRKEELNLIKGYEKHIGTIMAISNAGESGKIENNE